MPALGGLHLVIAIGLAIHAMKTGRPYWWLFILLFLPGLGSLAYVIVEIIPALVQSRPARSLTSDIGTMVDPGRELRERTRRAELVDSVDAKRALAGEYERKGMWPDAIRLYEAAATGIFADDPAVLLGLARAQVGDGNFGAALGTLGKMRAANPKLANQEADLLHVRALEGSGRIEEALAGYRDVSRSYAGFEARARYGLLLMKQGLPEEARQMFEEVVKGSRARPVVITKADREWIKLAKVHLR